MAVHNCNLVSPNAKNFVKANGKFDFERFIYTVKRLTRWMDNMITINKLPLPEIDYITKGIRPIGMGIMGFADALVLMGLKYNSKKARDFGEKLIKTMRKAAVETSIELAKERGVYPLWEGSEWWKKGIKIRNSNHISIAPTGSISFIAQVSSGIEPIFALVYSRRTCDGTLYYVVNKEFENALKALGIYSDELMQKVVDNHGSCQGISEIPKHIQEVFVTAHDITPADHVLMLSAIQTNTDLSVSKTVNFGNNATVEDLEEMFISAYTNNCKGVTAYRDGSRENQTLAVTRDKKIEEKSPCSSCTGCSTLARGEVVPAPDEADGRTVKFSTGCGNAYLRVDWDENRDIIQTFVDKGSTGTCSSNQEAVSRLISYCLRGGLPLDGVIDQLNSVDSCPSYVGARRGGKTVSKGSACPHAIAHILKKVADEIKRRDETVEYKPVEEVIITPVSKVKTKNICPTPDCGAEMAHESGCVQCKQCGYTRCG
jgi:ribonucleoside-diphosphate reductase alpha chain